ncbi:hypothetical protein L7F22_067303 [Adiantum nelumboides]|nr:hypothetical protein [Adiantum nelumboides]
MAKIKETARFASWDAEVFALKSKRGRPKRSAEELAHADAAKPKQLCEVSITASVGGGDIDKALMVQMQQFLEKDCVAGMCSLERGGATFHLHLQIVVRIMATSIIAISKKAKSYLEWDKSCPLGGSVLCRALQQKDGKCGALHERFANGGVSFGVDEKMENLFGYKRNVDVGDLLSSFDDDIHPLEEGDTVGVDDGVDPPDPNEPQTPSNAHTGE